MFDKLDDLLIRFEEVLNELGEPDVTANPDRFQKLMKEQSDLQPIVDTYKEYKKNKETIQDSLSMLEEEKDEEMREMLKEELSGAKARIEELRRAAKADLPGRIGRLSEATGLKCEKLSIRASRTKWGSCSGRNHISLSLFLMTLPEHLRDYVIVHEL